MRRRSRLARAGALAPLLAAPLAALLAPVAGAQAAVGGDLRVAPQYLQYRLGEPSGTTISQLAVPLFASVALGERLTLDVGTAFARSRVVSGPTTSDISGLTDTEVRGNLTLGSDLVVLTAGLNLPTGQASVTPEQFSAAGLIGNDFLAFPISNMGTGFALTGGVAVARPVGEWNLGFGGAVRRATAYEPFAIPGQTLRFQPGTEYRARVGVDRAAGAGRVALGLTYSAFGDDDAGGSVYSTGDRVIAQGVYSGTAGGRTLTFAAYNVFRAPGSYATGTPAGRENIANLFASVGIAALGSFVEPSVELRSWLQQVPGFTSGTTTTPDRSQHSMLGTFGLRTRVMLGGVSAYPSVGYTAGTLATSDPSGAPGHASLTGFRGQIAMRVGH